MSISGLEMGFQFDNSYHRLPNVFYEPAHPVSVQAPGLVILNQALALQLGLNIDFLTSPAGIAILAGNDMLEGMQPLAQAYAGHQFGHFTVLGDGRAILLGEHISPEGQRVDIQLKGSGQTAYSRRGDGRAALGPMLREYIISEAMHALGIPTTRSLAVVATGEPVYRETVLQGAVLTRVAASHIRVGTFEHAAALGDIDVLEALADYTIARHYPHLQGRPNIYPDFLEAVIDRQVRLIAKWMHVGFIHGVMNTDNMAISGETIDYGPCAFMDAYDPATVFSSIDHQGRYAFGNQSRVAAWNLARFAETLVPLLDEEEDKAIAKARELLAGFSEKFQLTWLNGMRAKLGLLTITVQDEILVRQLLDWMYQTKADYTNTFRMLAFPELCGKLCAKDPDFEIWYKQWQQKLLQEGRDWQEIQQQLCQTNPSVIPRNHRVEEALEAATQQDDFTVMENLLSVLTKPFQDSPLHETYSQSSNSEKSRCYKTFCGT